MDNTHLHLILNHFPILGTLFALCILGWGILRKNTSLESAGFVTLIIISLLTIPVFLTGKEAHEPLDQVPGVSDQYLEEHEELAKKAIWLMFATGAMSLITMIVSKGGKSRKVILNVITLLLAAGSLGIMTVVGNYGGKIRHSELRDDAETSVNEHMETHDHSAH